MTLKKKEAARDERKRPKSREETPKEGMCDKIIAAPPEYATAPHK